MTPPARPPRALVVSHLTLPHVGGVENLVDLEIRALVAAGHEVALLTSDGGGAGREPVYPAAVRLVRVPAWHGLEARFRIPYPLFGPRLVAALWRELGWCDVVHAHGFLFANTALAVWLARLAGKPSVLSDHGGVQQFSSPLVTRLARLGAETVGRLTVQSAGRVVVYNSRVQRDLARLRRRNDVAFLPNPVDRTLFHPPDAAARAAARRALGWSADRPKVLFAGRLIAAKGVPLLLAAADPAFDLVFCGPGDPSILGPLPRPGIEYLPPRPQAELVALYHAADAFALPADTREGFPLVVQEALSCGLPVVLGYDPGFEPYRALAGLTFCDRTAAGVRAAIRTALAAGAGGMTAASAAGFFPPLEEWVRTLYQLNEQPGRS
ncbi:glycosyltransferase family 4 protein [Fimbriiglobus ruber]|uniref:Glycosyltransferase n=1 Tax=Fimbriiglobus ruber TaxID=1908690 RepID=A0A225DTZ0_9BACT|nr:glycosyltransferase family 4 protein [Fimbriiglobus ruber]OWK44970.1 Glycosyltransferase [Fimbriiglobus ruber]